jgi:heme-degrading monooxygenase HmoA
MSANLTVHDYPGTTTPFSTQFDNEGGPVTFINTFILPSAEAEALFLAHWHLDSKSMKAQYGMLSGQLHRSVGPNSNIYVNIAIWESIEAFRNAFRSAEFQQSLGGYPKGTVMYPVMLKKQAVPGVCTA